MSWVAVAVAGTALVSSYMQSQSAKNAANAQIGAANAANQNQMNIYQNQKNLQAPWRNAGASSVGYLSYLMGVPGYENWQPGMDGNGKPMAVAQAPDVKKGGWNPITGFGNHAWSTGGVLGGADGGLSSIAGAIGLSAHPQNTGNESAQTPTSFAAPTGSQSLPKFNSPYEAGFQQLPSGAQFLGPDGIVRRKH